MLKWFSGSGKYKLKSNIVKEIEESLENVQIKT